MESDSLQQIEMALEAAKRAHPQLTPLLNLQRDLVAAQWATRAILPPLPTGGWQDRIRSRLEEGWPSVTFSDLKVDWKAFVGLYNQVKDILKRHRPEVMAIDPPHVTLEMVRQWYEGETDLSGERLAFMLMAAMKPFLTRVAELVLPYINQDLWRRGRCPVCGGLPDFALLDQERGSRYLFCSRCDTQWLFKRVECPFCSNDDPASLAYFVGEDETYRLYVCEVCHRWLKAVDLRQGEKKLLLPVERVLTLGLDEQAILAGYGSPERLDIAQTDRPGGDR